MESFRDVVFKKEAPMKKYITENIDLIKGNVDYATKQLKEAFSHANNGMTEFMEFAPYDGPTNNAVIGYKSSLIGEGANECVNIRLFNFDRVGFGLKLFNEDADPCDVGALFNKAKDLINEKVIGECVVDPDGMSLIIHRSDLPNIPKVTTEQTHDNDSLLEIFGFGKKKNKTKPEDDPNYYISQADYDRIKKTYGNKSKLPPSNGIDIAAFIICDYKLEDFKKFCSKKDTDDFVRIMKANNGDGDEDFERMIKLAESKNFAKVMDNKDHHYLGWYCSTTNKLYWLFDDSVDSKGTGFGKLKELVELVLEGEGIYYLTPFKKTNKEE